MRPGPTIALLALVLLTVLNIAVWHAPSYGFFSWQAALNFYWVESILLGAFALLLYAKHLLVFFLILTPIAYILGFQNFLFMGDAKIPLTFWGIYSLFWLVYFEIRRSYLGHKIRLLHPLLQLLYYAGYIAAAILLSVAVTSYVYFGQLLFPAMQGRIFEDFLAMAAGIPTLTITMLKIIDMIGERHVLYFLLGTYQHPVEKKKIVMFIDMVGSSASAERLSPKKSMEMVARFIFDACAACRIHGGDIVNYTGDGLVVLWPLFGADKAIRAYENLRGRLESGRESYERAFGIVPDFRIGLHAGNVVISQIGEEKLFLGVYGDVVNTAARLEQLNKETGTRILLSRAVKQFTSPPVQKRIRPLGEAEVRGKEEAIDIFTLAE